jgi:hypothetical protein
MNKGTDDSINKTNKLVHKCGKKYENEKYTSFEIFWAS